MESASSGASTSSATSTTSHSEEPPSTTREQVTPEQFDVLKEAVLSKRPILRDILRKSGQKNLYEYAKEYFSVNLNPPIKFRQTELIATVRAEVAEKLDSTIADTVAKQLEEYYFISTADHMGPIAHPWFLNSNLLIAAPYMDMEKEQPGPLRNVIAVACANISLNNTSFPRGLVFHSSMNGKVKMHRLSFLPSNSHSCSVYGFRPYTHVEVDKMRKLLREKVREGEVHAKEAAMITDLLTDVYDRPEVLACKTYSEQMTRTNFELWKRFFPQNGKPHPNLIYLEQESLVVRLIIDFHLDQDTTIYHQLFDPEYDPLITQYFDGVLYAFSTAERRGTYLFWGISEDKNYRVQLWKEGRYLVSTDGSVRIELSPGAIREALLQRKIIPSILLTFDVLCFYYGLKCLGGFTQVNYLTFMKNAYLKMQVDRGNYRSIEMCARAQTKEMVDGTIAYLGAPDGSLLPATGIDLILYGNEHRWQHLIEELKTMTVQDALLPDMPDFYRFVCPGDQNDPALSNISAEQITRLIGLDRKIRPCVTITDHSTTPAQQ